MGAFIDFWLGKRGEERFRGWLETWWLRLSYVRWGTLGRDEALFAVQVIERLFGRRLLSIRRFASTAAIIFSSFCLVAVHYVIEGLPIPWDIMGELNNLLWLVLLFLFTSVSLSITHFAAVQAGKFLNKRPYLNLIGIIFVLYLQYLVFRCSFISMEGIQISLAANMEYFIKNWHAMTLSIALILIRGSISNIADFIWSALTRQSLAFHPIITIQLIFAFLPAGVGEAKYFVIRIATG